MHCKYARRIVVLTHACKARVKELETELADLQEYKERKERRTKARHVLRKNLQAWLLRRRFKRLVSSFHVMNRKDLEIQGEI